MQHPLMGCVALARVGKGMGPTVVRLGPWAAAVVCLEVGLIAIQHQLEGPSGALLPHGHGIGPMQRFHGHADRSGLFRGRRAVDDEMRCAGHGRRQARWRSRRRFLLTSAATGVAAAAENQQQGHAGKADGHHVRPRYNKNPGRRWALPGFCRPEPGGNQNGVHTDQKPAAQRRLAQGPHQCRKVHVIDPACQSTGAR
ncbi:hypothetical protein D3C81_1392660 [compost metagenome]